MYNNTHSTGNAGGNGTGQRAGEPPAWKSIPTSEITKSWGSKRLMALSYGIKWPDEIEEVDAIIDAMKEQDWENMSQQERDGYLQRARQNHTNGF